jgi:hypothetical protein
MPDLSPEGADSYEERLARYRKFVHRRGWLIALTLTVFGEGTLIALTRDPVPNLVAAPFAFVILLLALRLGTKLAGTGVPDEAERPPAMFDRSIEPEDRSSRSAETRAPLVRRNRVFGAGAVLLLILIGASAVLWSIGARGHARPESLTWIVFGLGIANAVILAILSSPTRLRRSFRKRHPSGGISTASLASGMSWLAVASVLTLSTVGLGLFLASGQAWRLVPFALLSVVMGSLLWWRLGKLGQSDPH